MFAKIMSGDLVKFIDVERIALVLHVEQTAAGKPYVLTVLLGYYADVWHNKCEPYVSTFAVLAFEKTFFHKGEPCLRI